MPNFSFDIFPKSWAALLFAAILCFPALAKTESAESIIISEIMFNPDGDENAREFVEIQNLSGADISLEGFSIGDGAGFDKLIPAENGWIVPSGGFAVIFDPDYFTCEDYFDIPVSIPLFTIADKAIGDRGLSNSTAETVYLISSAGDTLSRTSYSLDCPPGHSWECIIPDKGSEITNFNSSAETGGTPGRKNSATPDGFNPALTTTSISFDSLAVKAGQNLEISVSWLNGGLSPSSGIHVKIQIEPGICSASLTFTEETAPGLLSAPQKTEIGPLPGGRLTLKAFISNPELQNTVDDTLSLTIDVPVPENTVILNEVMAAPSSGNPEWVELLNTGAYPVNLRDWTISDSSDLSSAKIPGDTFIAPSGLAVISKIPINGLPESTPNPLSSVFPTLNNDIHSVYLFDFLGAPLDSMSYENAETGKSFELISPELRGRKTSWDICVSPDGSTPGKPNSINYSSVPPEKRDSENIELSIRPNPFREDTTVSYKLPFPLARVKLIVFDRHGRQVATLREEDESGSEWRGNWNGRSDNARLSAGPYILYLEALDKKSGRVCTVKKPLVIAARL